MKLSQLGVTIGEELSVDLVLSNLTCSHGPWVIKYYKNELSLTISELVNLLMDTE